MYPPPLIIISSSSHIMKIKNIFALSITFVLSAFLMSENNLPKSAWKKIDNEIEKLWPEVEIQKELLKNEDYQLFKLSNNDETKGYLFIAKAPSRYDYFDYMLIYSPDLTIKMAKILVYRESYGGEIGSTRWLKQFIGYSKDNEFRLGHDVQGISGATISCKAATDGFKSSTQIINTLKENGVL